MTQTNNTSVVSKIGTDVNVGMKEVVAVFVAKYETDLYDKKDQLSNAIRDAKAELKSIDEELEASIDMTKYSGTLVGANITTFADDVTICWDGNYHAAKEEIVVCVYAQKTGTLRKDANLVYRDNIKIPAEYVARRTKANEELSALNAELVEVFGLIKSVGRKARQVEGRIAEMTLQESGMSGLLNNPELLKLVSIS